MDWCDIRGRRGPLSRVLGVLWDNSVGSQLTPDIAPVQGQCWSIVANDGPTLSLHRFNASGQLRYATDNMGGYRRPMSLCRKLLNVDKVCPVDAAKVWLTGCCSVCCVKAGLNRRKKQTFLKICMHTCIKLGQFKLCFICCIACWDISHIMLEVSQMVW